jgi:glycosyltransferase involved in cell wall biosynthesis
MAKILFIKPADSSFIRKDERFLRANYQTKVFYFRYGKFFRVLLSQIELSWWLARNIISSKAVFIWFADYHTLIPVLTAMMLRKGSIVVIGGYDAARIPEINYGVFVRRFRGFCVKWTFKLASYILPVDESLVQGIDRYVGKVKGRILVVPTGYDPDRWKGGQEKERDLILTVCSGDTLRVVRRKGIDLVAECARRLPHLRFLVIGLEDKARGYVEDMAPSNMRMIGEMSPEDLLTYYQRAKVYLQLSLFEGLPNALCEAMLCECVPIGTGANGIPGAIGETGFILKERSVDGAAGVIREALASDRGSLARERIMRMFSVERREKALRKIIDGSLGISSSL